MQGMKTNTYSQPFVDDAIPSIQLTSPSWKPMEREMRCWTAFATDTDPSCLQALDAAVSALSAITSDREALPYVTASASVRPNHHRDQRGLASLVSMQESPLGALHNEIDHWFEVACLIERATNNGCVFTAYTHDDLFRLLEQTLSERTRIFTILQHMFGQQMAAPVGRRPASIAQTHLQQNQEDHS